MPSTVTWRSCMASSSAAWVFGGVRLISSARRMLVKTAPRGRPARCRGRRSEPVRSEGSRSGVNWTRRRLETAGPSHGRRQERLGHPRGTLEQQVPADGQWRPGRRRPSDPGRPPPWPPRRAARRGACRSHRPTRALWSCPTSCVGLQPCEGRAELDGVDSRSLRGQHRVTIRSGTAAARAAAATRSSSVVPGTPERRQSRRRASSRTGRSTTAISSAGERGEGGGQRVDVGPPGPG